MITRRQVVDGHLILVSLVGIKMKGVAEDLIIATVSSTYCRGAKPGGWKYFLEHSA